MGFVEIIFSFYSVIAEISVKEPGVYWSVNSAVTLLKVSFKVCVRLAE